mgnify:CR=1 FL=1|jgi:hypothetical protein
MKLFAHLSRLQRYRAVISKLYRDIYVYIKAEKPISYGNIGGNAEIESFVQFLDERLF